MRPRSTNYLSRQNGSVILGFLFSFILASMILGVSSMMQSDIYKEIGNESINKSSYLNSVQSGLNNHIYGPGSFDFSAPGLNLTTAEIIRLSGNIERYGVKTKISKFFGYPCASGATNLECAPYYVIAIWLPPQSAIDSTTFDPDTATLTLGQGAVGFTLSGLSIQGLKIQRSIQSLDRASANLLSAAKSIIKANNVGVVGVFNALRDNTCPTVTNDMQTFPCYDSYTPLGDELGKLTGVRAGAYVSPWATPLEVSNLQDASATSAPYTMVLRYVTPWGGIIQRLVVLDD